jgi:hypothetical protein
MKKKILRRKRKFKRETRKGKKGILQENILLKGRQLLIRRG